MNGTGVSARDFALRSRSRIIRDTILPVQMQAAIYRQCPGLSISELENALDAYRFANALAPVVPPTERRANLERVAELATQLGEALSQISMADQAKLRRFNSKRPKARDPVSASGLAKLAELAMKVAADIQPSAGRPLTRRAYIVRDVAKELRRSGFVIDASSKGPLVFITSELLSLLDEPNQDVRSLVRNTLAKLDFDTLDFCQASPP